MNEKNQNLAIAAIKAAMSNLSLTQEELAGILGRAQPTISEILRGNRSLSPEIAIDFEAALNGQVEAGKLLEMQAAFQLEEARKGGSGSAIRLKAQLRSEFPVNEMEKRGWIPKSDDLQAKLKEVLAFANGSPDLDNIRPAFNCQPLARQSVTLGHLTPAGSACRAWLYRVRELAEMTPVKEFDHEFFTSRGLSEIRGLARDVKGVAQVPQILAKFGVRFVIVEHLAGTKLDGAAMWLDGEARLMPVIALTLRIGKIDSFWFNLAHELQHIKHMHSFSVDNEIGKDEDGEENQIKEIEKEANSDAAEWLIPQDRFNAFIQRNRGKISSANIQAFSQMVNIHPGILVGMLQYRKAIPYSRFTETKPEIRKLALLAAMADGWDSPLAQKRSNRNI